MSEQPKALRLATLLEIDHRNKAAAELRRQHSRIAELEAALDAALEALGWADNRYEEGLPIQVAIQSAINLLKEVRRD